MAELVVRFDVRVPRSSVRWLLTAGMLLAATPELGSENFTLTTYYPSPSGIYTQMITTGNTFLARDGGSVGIGTGSPAHKLHVAGGNAHFTGRVNAGGYAVQAADVNAQSIEIGGPAPTATNGQATIFLHDHGTVAHQLRYANGTLFLERAGNGYGTNARPRLELPAGNVEARHFMSDLGPGNCRFRQYIANGTTNCTPNVEYATTIAGLVSRRIAMPPLIGNNSRGNMLCCECPLNGAGVPTCPY